MTWVSIILLLSLISLSPPSPPPHFPLSPPFLYLSPLAVSPPCQLHNISLLSLSFTSLSPPLSYLFHLTLLFLSITSSSHSLDSSLSPLVLYISFLTSPYISLTSLCPSSLALSLSLSIISPSLISPPPSYIPSISPLSSLSLSLHLSRLIFHILLALSFSSLSHHLLALTPPFLYLSPLAVSPPSYLSSRSTSLSLSIRTDILTYFYYKIFVCTSTYFTQLVCRPINYSERLYLLFK